MEIIWLRWWSICLQCRRPGFDPWFGKIPWRRKWQPTPVFLPGKSHGQRSLVDCSPWGHKALGTTEWLTLSTLCKLKRHLFCKKAILITVCSCSKNIGLIFEIKVVFLGHVIIAIPFFRVFIQDSYFITPRFLWFCTFFSAGQALLSALSWCSACTSVSEGVFLMYPWREMYSMSTYSSAILFLIPVF